MAAYLHNHVIWNRRTILREKTVHLLLYHSTGPHRLRGTRGRFPQWSHMTEYTWWLSGQSFHSIFTFMDHISSRTFHGNKGDPRQTQTPIKTTSPPLHPIRSRHSHYSARRIEPFKGLIRISNGKLTTLSTVNELQTALKLCHENIYL